MCRSYLPWFEVFFRLLNYISDVVKCCSSDSELHDVESLLEHLMSTDVSRPSQHVDVTLPLSGLVSCGVVDDDRSPSDGGCLSAHTPSGGGGCLLAHTPSGGGGGCLSAHTPSGGGGCLLAHTPSGGGGGCLSAYTPSGGGGYLLVYTPSGGGGGGR